MRKQAGDLKPGDVIETEWSTRSGETIWLRTSTVSSVSDHHWDPGRVVVSTKEDQPDRFVFKVHIYVTVVDQVIPETEE